MDVLIRIKWALLAGRYTFSKKARTEMEIDDLTELDITESILSDATSTRNFDRPMLPETNDANTFT